MSALDPADTARLIKFLGMLGSSHVGERAAAGLKAHNLIIERNVCWKDVVAPAQLPPPRATPFTGGLDKGCATRLLTCGFAWNEWERAFLNSIGRWRGGLTPKQKTRLRELGAAAEAWLAEQGGDCDY